MSIESTIASLLEQAKEFKAQNLDEKVQPEQEGPVSAEQNPENKKNDKQEEKEAEGGTSKVANKATAGAVPPEAKETLSMKEDIEALFNGEDGLTEEFRNKAETIFEAAVVTRVKEEVARIEEELETYYGQKLQEEIESQVEGLVEHIDGYLNLVVEKWMEENVIALESGMKADILESFVLGMKKLFAEHYIEVPEEKFDVLGSMESKIQELNYKLDEAVALAVEQAKELKEMKKEKLISEACVGLTDLQAEKLKTLAEEITFDDLDTFADKVTVIKENYFGRQAKEEVVSTPSILAEETIQEEKVVPVEMRKYVDTLSTLLRK